MPGIYHYFFPKRKLYATPKHISARYDRSEMTKEQSIIIMAGLARDPQQAQEVYIELKEKHGNKIWKYVEFHVRRQRTQTFYERLMMLMRKIFGEDERPNLRSRADDSIIKIDYEFRGLGDDQ